MKLSVIAIALGLISSTPCVDSFGNDCDTKDKDSTTALLTQMKHDFEAGLRAQGDAYELSAADLKVTEAEEETDLGFDTSAYLPEGFDPYKGMIDEVEAIGLIETEEEEIDLGFDTSLYLPEGFDPYEGMVDEVEAIGLIEIEEEEIDLGFDTGLYLPEDFDPYKGMEGVEGVPTAELKAELDRYDLFAGTVRPVQ